MICEKCGKEIPENETVCPDCGGEETVMESAMEQVEETVAPAEEIALEETIAEETADAEEPAFDLEELGVPVSNVVRKKRGLARVIIGIVSLVIAIALVVVSLLNPVMLLGNWKRHEEMPLYEGVSLKVDLSIEFGLSGKCIQYQKLVNADELGVAKADSEYTDNFQYAIVNEKIRLNEDVESDVCYKATPSQLTIWADGYPEDNLQYQREGLFYPSMILWVAGGVFLILGILLLAIPGKKHVVTTYEEEEEAEDLDEFLEEIYEEIEEDSNQDIPEEPIVEEVAEESVTEEVAETPEATEE